MTSTGWGINNHLPPYLHACFGWCGQLPHLELHKMFKDMLQRYSIVQEASLPNTPLTQLERHRHRRYTGLTRSGSHDNVRSCPEMSGDVRSPQWPNMVHESTPDPRPGPAAKSSSPSTARATPCARPRPGNDASNEPRATLGETQRHEYDMHSNRSLQTQSQPLETPWNLVEPETILHL